MLIVLTSIVVDLLLIFILLSVVLSKCEYFDKYTWFDIIVKTTMISNSTLTDFKNFENSTKCLIMYLQFTICMYKHFRSIFNRGVNW